MEERPRLQGVLRTHLNTVKALNTLLDIKKVLDKLGVVFWLDGGTLLGAYRENSFMESDFDIDVGIKGEDGGRLKEVRDALDDLGFGSFHLKEHPWGEGKQLSWVKDGIPGDIFTYYRRDTRRFRVMFDIFSSGLVRFIPCVYPAHLFDTFQTIDFMDYGVEFNMPSPVEEYLEKQYGDWKTDKSKEEFHWQTDYKSMDMGFPISPKPAGKRRWRLTEKLKARKEDGSFFIPFIKEGYKLYPITIDQNDNVLDGNKRVSAYQQLGVPIVECYATTV